MESRLFDEANEEDGKETVDKIMEEFKDDKKNRTYLEMMDIQNQMILSKWFALAEAWNTTDVFAEIVLIYIGKHRTLGKSWSVNSFFWGVTCLTWNMPMMKA